MNGKRFIEIFQRGLVVGLKLTWKLAKIVLPISFIMTLLSFTPVLGWIIELISPVTAWMGLSGNATIPLVLGMTVNIYAAVGAALNLALTVKELFIIAVMTSFAHNLFVETGVGVKLGVRAWIIVSLRIGVAVVAAVLINLFWSGGNEIAEYGLVHLEAPVVEGAWQITVHSVQVALSGVLQIATIVIPLMIVVQFLKELNWLEKISKWLAPLTRIFGLKEKHSLALVAGICLGFVYGAGIILQAAEEDEFSKLEIMKIVTILIAAHAVFEDTLLFIPVGVAILPLLIIRIITAIVLTLFVTVMMGRNKTSEENKNIAI